jgi:predicted amidohydrolase YtcJ
MTLTADLLILAILERDPCAVDPWEIRDIRVERTIIGGEVVFER